MDLLRRRVQAYAPRTHSFREVSKVFTRRIVGPHSFQRQDGQDLGPLHRRVQADAHWTRSTRFVGSVFTRRILGTHGFRRQNCEDLGLLHRGVHTNARWAQKCRLVGGLLRDMIRHSEASPTVGSVSSGLTGLVCFSLPRSLPLTDGGPRVRGRLEGL